MPERLLDNLLHEQADRLGVLAGVYAPDLDALLLELGDDQAAAPQASNTSSHGS